MDQSIEAKVLELQRMTQEAIQAQQQNKHHKILQHVTKIANAKEEVTQQEFRKLSFAMADEEFVKTLNVYYCTEFGKVKGHFQISQSRIFFEPSSSDNKDLGQLRRFEVCIDMGDVI